MSTTPSTQPRFPNRPARPITLVVAAILCVILAACTTDGSEPTTSLAAPPPTADPEPIAAEPVDALAVVVSAIDAYNGGDYEGWQSHYLESGDDDLAKSEIIAGASIELETGDCATTAGADATVVECPATVADAFHSIGGLTGTGVMTFTVNDAGLITDDSSTFYEDEAGRCCPEWQAYHQRFFRWLERVHPDVFDEIGPADGRPQWFLPGVASGNPEHMRVALDYVGDFVVQSDSYPLGQTAQDLAPVVEPLGRGAFVTTVSGEIHTLIEGAVVTGGPFASGSDVVFAKITIPAGGTAPWHSHGGPAVLVNIGPGTVSSAITDGCVVQEIAPGSAFLDPGGGIPHTAVNRSEEDVALYAVFLAVEQNPVIATEEPHGCAIG